MRKMFHLGLNRALHATAMENGRSTRIGGLETPSRCRTHGTRPNVAPYPRAVVFTYDSE